MLNISIAGQRFTTSTTTAQHVSTLVFQHGEQSDIEEEIETRENFQTSTTVSTKTIEDVAATRSI
jgi:hypothetical protein